MPRRRYYRRYTRVVPAKKKWASNIITGTIGTAGSGEADNLTLVANSSPTATPTPVIVKTGNFKIQGDAYLDVRTGGGNISVAARVFVLYTPEGVTSDFATVIGQHPEWIMGWTQLDLPITNAAAIAAGNRFTLSTRLKRNLNSGDKIRIVVIGGGDNNKVVCQFTAQFFTCAN